MKFSIGNKLSGLIGILLVLFLALGAIAYLGIRTINRQVSQVIEVELPTTAAAYEMDVNLLEMVVGVLGYLEERDQMHLERMSRGRTMFKQVHEEYEGGYQLKAGHLVKTGEFRVDYVAEIFSQNMVA